MLDDYDYSIDNISDFNDFIDNFGYNEFNQEEESEEVVSGDVRENELDEQLDSEDYTIYEFNIDTDVIIEQFAIVEDKQQQIINNLSYQSNLFTLGFFVFVGVLIMKCLLHFFN